MKKYLYIVFILLLWACENPKPYGDLYVQVRDEQGKEVVNGKVNLYASHEDFVDQKNAVAQEQTTDVNGLAFFLKLDSGSYYVSASLIDTANGIEKNNFLVNTEVKVVSTEIGYRNSITVIIWDSFITHLTSPTGKKWVISRMIDNATGEDVEIPDCSKDDEWVFYRNGTFKYNDLSANCAETDDDSFEGTFAPVGNGSYILIQDQDQKVRYGLYIISVTANQMLAQYGPHLIYYQLKQ
ncbi:lipocalin family protein [Flammeovirga yaeyamensis]|uniref:Lipocalin family protein n=1 Tax=Flammeovirga yaeyamensis TaxID=367791 RepID=A0AAX1MZX9_9BACT|nr:lipocalin family protein [Flammeovirga yaeyamensis]MBB3700270.1 uncharacterized protein (DUF2141 family) [Flammeovirga yaeyamensis]NMF37104.1 hypothetical protein [Flammeovirga yaeyamensis]QWG00795.1 lipocalin family protein [Flammeovirga yaeyamensis]